MIHVGHVREITRYPIKSMAGVPTESAMLGWHGLDGDRRFAFRRLQDNSGFPWLSAGRLPELLLYQPFSSDQGSDQSLPTHVRTPTGSHLKLPSAELNEEISQRFGSAVELMNLKHGIFDEATISVISLATIAGIGREAEIGDDLDRRRFRMNLVVETDNRELFLEDEWIGHTLAFGDSNAPPAVKVIMPDERCVMINLNPDTAANDARVMKTVVRLNQYNAGVYATVVQTGMIQVGDLVRLSDNGA
jgi:uncharacterized protein